MQENKIVIQFRNAKIIEIIALLFFGVGFLLILLLNPWLAKSLYQDKPLFLLCAIAWLSILYHLGTLLHDFVMLKSFVIESHTLTKEAYLDDLTGIPNRHGLDYLFQTYDTEQSLSNIGCYAATIHNLASINKTMERAVGDNLIRDFCNILEQVSGSKGIVGRNGGNEFLVVLNHCNQETLNEFLKQMTTEVSRYNLQHHDAPMILKETHILNIEEKASSFLQLLVTVHNKLFSNETR